MPSLQPLRKELLELALDYYLEFIEQVGNDRSLQSELGHAYFRVGQIRYAIDSWDKALTSHRKAMEIQRELVERNPANLEYQRGLAQSYREIAYRQNFVGKHEEAAHFIAEARRILEDLSGNGTGDDYQLELALTYHHSGIERYHSGSSNEEQLYWYQKAKAIYENLLSANPDHVNHLEALSSLNRHIGNAQEEVGRIRDCYSRDRPVCGNANEVVSTQARFAGGT